MGDAAETAVEYTSPRNTAAILVLFILLVIITLTFAW